MKASLFPATAASALLAFLAFAALLDAHAGQFDIRGPAGSGAFGTSVTVLPNGNILVTDPSYSIPGGAAYVGAVYLYDGVTLTNISTITGSTANDSVGYGSVTVLSNGNYVINVPYWDNGAVADVGAVTWGSGTTGVTGVVSAANSLVGTTANDHVGFALVTALSNGNYVVNSSDWNGSRGAVTWGSGTTGVTGAVSSANSLVGSTAYDSVGYGGVTALANGSYVVASPLWNGYRGAVTWGSGTTGVTGVVSAANSLVGTTAYDYVGSTIALNNGNYVVDSYSWNGYRGAVTWGSGTTGATGVVSAANSLVGTTANDYVGIGNVAGLGNGNYVVNSYYWNGYRGAVTWGSGTTGVTGAVSSANSLVGSTANDNVGYGGVTPLNNSNYVVSSWYWDNGAVANAGAVTWGSGTTGVTGAVSSANSLVGSTANDQVGSGGYWGVTALANGNYVVTSTNWDNGAVVNAGAVTWGSGTTGVTGAVSSVNSLVGSTANDSVGYGGVTALANGNYVVSSRFWDNGSATDAGAVTWGNGTTGVTGAVSSANSLVGTASNEQVGYGGATPLANGSYVVASPYWNVNRGATTWGSGATGVTGTISSANSLVGGTANDQLGTDRVTALNNGNYVLRSSYWDNGLLANAGAVSWGDGTLGTKGFVTTANSVLGTGAGGGASMRFAFDYLNSRLFVADPAGNRVSVFGSAPQIVLEQPLNVNLTNGATCIFGAPVGTNASLTFTIRNTGFPSLTGLGITISGIAAGNFSVVTNPVAPVSGPFGSTTFTVRFAPTMAGVKTPNLRIASNDLDENPFIIHLSGWGLTFTEDTDGDGLSDAAEFYLSSLGFDWQVSQPGLVNMLFTNANTAGLYTSNQVQALNVATPLLAKDPLSGLFKLTIGVQKSTNLADFNPFPMTAPQTLINGQGKLEFQFSAPDNAAFYRLESK